MTFEEWWSTYLYLGDDLDKEIAQVAWEAGAESVVNSKLIPEGYVLVPVEPTEAMRWAGHNEMHGLNTHASYVSIYKAMIQAAQEEE